MTVVRSWPLLFLLLISLFPANTHSYEDDDTSNDGPFYLFNLIFIFSYLSQTTEYHELALPIFKFLSTKPIASILSQVETAMFHLKQRTAPSPKVVNNCIAKLDTNLSTLNAHPLSLDALAAAHALMWQQQLQGFFLSELYNHVGQNMFYLPAVWEAYLAPWLRVLDLREQQTFSEKDAGMFTSQLTEDFISVPTMTAHRNLDQLGEVYQELHEFCRPGSTVVNPHLPNHPAYIFNAPSIWPQTGCHGERLIPANKVGPSMPEPGYSVPQVPESPNGPVFAAAHPGTIQALGKKIYSDLHKQSPFHKRTATFQAISAALGPFSPENILTKRRAFSVLIWHGITYPVTTFNCKQYCLFDDPVHWQDAIWNKDKKEYVEGNCYGGKPQKKHMEGADIHPFTYWNTGQFLALLNKQGSATYRKIYNHLTHLDKHKITGGQSAKVPTASNVGTTIEELKLGGAQGLTALSIPRDHLPLIVGLGPAEALHLSLISVTTRIPSSHATGLTGPIYYYDGSQVLVEQATGLPVQIVANTSINMDMSAIQVSGIFPQTPSPAGSRGHSGPSESSIASSEQDTAIKNSREVPRGSSPMAELLSRIQPGLLSQDDLTRLHLIRAMLSTSREHLLASTVLITQQQELIAQTHESIIELRDRTASHLASLHNEVTSGQSKINRILNDNVRVLRELGVSNMALDSIMASTTQTALEDSPKPKLPPLGSVSHRSASPPKDIQGDMESVVAPRGTNESTEEYERRIIGVLRRKERASAAFVISNKIAENRPADQITQELRSGYAPRSQPYVPTSILDIGGISTAIPNCNIRFGTLPTTNAPSTSFAGINQKVPIYQPNVPAEQGSLTVFDEYNSDMAQVIRSIIDRHVGKTLALPPGVRPAKVDSPSKYAGTDDHNTFIRFLEKICNWLRSQLITGPDVDYYRVTLLAEQLEGHAADWLSDLRKNHMEATGEKPPFADVMCDMHRRFVTSANAQKATLDFESVHYDSSRGPDRLMNNLTTYGKRMREKPSDFTIRSAFFRLIPDKMYKLLVVDRGFTPEYSDAKSLLDHARQLWIGLQLAKLRTRVAPIHRPSRAHPLPSQQLNKVPARANTMIARASTTNATDGKSVPPLLQMIVPGTPAPNTQKTCFGCGQFGHIASDPSCPKNSDQPRYRDKPRVAAQQVLESYAEQGEGNTQHDEEESYWGEQYEPQPDDELGGSGDPNAAPDLDALVDQLDGEDDGEAPWVAMMQRQYFSMRIHEEDTACDGPEESALEDNPIPSSSTTSMVLTHTILRDLAEIDNNHLAAGMRPMSRRESTAARRQLKMTRSYPRPLNPTYAELLEDYEIETVKTGRPSEDELQSIQLVGREEQGREDWRNINPFDEYIAQTQEYQSLVIEQLGSRADTLNDLQQVAVQPHGSQSSASLNIALALRRNEETYTELQHHVQYLDRLRALNRAHDELNSSLLSAAIANGLFNEDPPEGLPLVEISSPPPGYPGSPHSSDELWIAERVPLEELRNSYCRGDPPEPEEPSNEGPEVVCRAGRLVATDEQDSPAYSYANPEFQAAHEAAITRALGNKAPQSDVSIKAVMNWDTSHEAVPVRDDKDYPLQVLAQGIEHTLCIRPPDAVTDEEDHTVGLMDQPTCSRKDLACLTAIQTINGQSAYVHATNAPQIRLTDQVTLQLGCVGNRSQIHSGTWVPVDMGRIKGHRMIQFPNGKVVKALSVLEETALIAERRAHAPGKAIDSAPNVSRIETVDEEEDEADYPYLLETECDYQRRQWIEDRRTNLKYEPMLNKQVDERPPEDGQYHTQIETDMAEAPPAQPVDGDIRTSVHIPLNASAHNNILLDHRKNTKLGTPGLHAQERITLHSGTQPTSWMGDDDPFRINSLAVDAAADILTTRANNPDLGAETCRERRLHPLRCLWTDICDLTIWPIHIPVLKQYSSEVAIRTALKCWIMRPIHRTTRS
ncbi:hypothetical protein C8J57DRAFT_1254214 [Mycena rebaudengoi]|nr:hypothetical protein C8J57DRAFT_1254214 [Mycena rebaudengoi]